MRARQAYRLKSRSRPRTEPSVRREEDGREICQANAVGRAEYTRRKQLLWADQGGCCATEGCPVAGRRLSLLDARMTGGNWEPTGQLRDDRIEAGSDGKPINELVHKACLAAYHEQRRQERALSNGSGGAGGAGGAGSDSLPLDYF
jgi:hypothetical protein